MTTEKKNELFRVIRPINYTDAKRTFVVLGSPRGGTSMLSGTLEKLGVFMGPALGPQKEDRRFRREVPLDQKVATLESNNADHDVWGWKLPNTIYFYGILHEHIINPVFITVYRNPFSVASSSARRDNRDFEQRLIDVPINHYKKMHKLLSDYPDIPLASCSFDEVLKGKNKEHFIDGLISFIDIPVPAKNRDEALDFIDYDKGYQK